MATFSRVRSEHASDLISQAQMRGLEHHLLSLGEGSGWATFQFLSENSKLSFDELARQMGVAIEADLPTLHLDDAISAVAEGDDPEVIHDLLIEAKKLSLTQGMKNAYNKLGSPRYVCSNDSCGAAVPRYSGRYPSTCPSCGGDLVTPQQKEEMDRAKMEAAKECGPCPKCGSTDVKMLKNGKCHCNACGYEWTPKE